MNALPPARAAGGFFYSAVRNIYADSICVVCKITYTSSDFLLTNEFAFYKLFYRPENVLTAHAKKLR